MSKQAQTRTMKLGKAGPEVFPLGLGCMGMSGTYGLRDDPESELRQELADLRAALHHEFAVLVWRFAGMLMLQAALIIVAIKFIP